MRNSHVDSGSPAIRRGAPTWAPSWAATQGRPYGCGGPAAIFIRGGEPQDHGNSVMNPFGCGNGRYVNGLRGERSGLLEVDVTRGPCNRLVFALLQGLLEFPVEHLRLDLHIFGALTEDGLAPRSLL